jgi:ankyrin repeat protein
LYYAVREGHEQIVRLLLNHNAPLEVGNIADYSLLNQAVNFGDANLVELLLDKRVDARGPSGAAALRSAIRAKRKDISGLLLRHGADPNADDSIESQKPLRYAIDWQHDLEEIKLLLRFGAKQNERGFNGQIALHAAADFCDVEVAQLLLEHGAIVDCKDDDGLTPLHMACSGLTDSEGRVPVARLLLEYNANLDATDNEFLTPLHHAATYPSRADVVRFLLESKAFVDARDVNGRTPLHNAVTVNGNETTVNLLLQHGADATVQDLAGCLPKHHIVADDARRYRLYMKHRLSSSWPR